ncbi:MAG TPA: GrpB family protein [Gaiellaceae bacterium]|nr:GrpB family protein [Gaiellaceae bacterium]
MIDQERRLRELLPGAEVHLSGSACLPGLDPEDLDLVVLVHDVAAAARTLRSEYPVLYGDEWRDDWAAFREPGPPQVDIVVTRPGTLGDRHHRLAWQFLAARPDLLEEYRALKETTEDYERRKREFFERVVALL